MRLQTVITFDLENLEAAACDSGVVRLEHAALMNASTGKKNTLTMSVVVWIFQVEAIFGFFQVNQRL